MAYQKQTWRDFDDTKTDLQNINNGAVVTPERLNHIENGIANSADKAEVTAQLLQIGRRLGERFVSVTEFGAVADANFYDHVNKKYYTGYTKEKPATDNKKAFQDAVDYAHSHNIGVVFVPAGNYAIKGSTTAYDKGIKWKTKVSLIGAGRGVSNLLGEGYLLDLIYQLDYASTGRDGIIPEAWLEDVTFADFTIDQKALTFSGENVNGKAIFILYMRRALFSNIGLFNTVGTALGCDFLVDSVIENNVIENAGRNWGTPNPDYGMLGIGQSGIGVGTGAYESEPLKIVNNTVRNCGNFGIFVETQDGDYNTDNVIINGNHTENNRIGVGNKGSGYALIDGNILYKNKEHGIEVSQNAEVGSVTNNLIYRNLGNGIQISSKAKDGDIKGNTIFENNIGINFDGDEMYNSYQDDFVIQSNNIYRNRLVGINFGKQGVNNIRKNIQILTNTITNNCRAYTAVQAEFAKGVNLQSIDKLIFNGNILKDTQTNPTQKRPIYMDTTMTNWILMDNVFNGVDMIGLLVNATGSKLKNNAGIPDRFQGELTFEADEVAITVVHNLAKPFRGVAPLAKYIGVTPLIDTSTVSDVPKIWVKANSVDSIRVQRDITTTNLQFFVEVVI